MMKKILLLLAAAAILLVGCSKERDDEAKNFAGYSYNVSIGDWTCPVLAGVAYQDTETGNKMKVGDIRQVSVTPKGSSPEPESISVSFSNDCFSWDSEKKTVKAEKTGIGVISVKFSVYNHEINAPFGVTISD